MDHHLSSYQKLLDFLRTRGYPDGVRVRVPYEPGCGVDLVGKKLGLNARNLISRPVFCDYVDLGGQAWHRTVRYTRKAFK